MLSLHDHKEPVDDSGAVLTEQLMQLLEAAAALLPSPDSESVLRRIISLAQRFVSADGCAIWRARSPDGDWALVSSAGLSPEFIRNGVTNNLHPYSAPLNTEPLIFEDVREHGLLDLRRPELEREGICSMLVIPLQIRDALTGTVTFYWRSRHTFGGAEISIGRALGSIAAAALGTVELYERETTLRNQAEASQRRLAFLAEAGAVLASSLDFQDTLRTVARLAISHFADWCAIDIVEDEQLERVTLAHVDPAKVQLADEYRRKFPPREDDVAQVALKTGESVLIETIPEAVLLERVTDPEQLSLIRAMGICSFIVTPMRNRGRTLGLITLVRSNPDQPYSPLDLELANELARRAAIAIDNTMLYAESQAAQTALQQTNRELVHANGDLSHFAYSVSHDLQEPLRMISVYCELLQRRHAGQLDSDARQYLDYAIQGTRQMEALIHDILSYASLAGSDNESGQVLDANTVLDKALVNLQPSIESARARVESSSLPTIPYPEVHLLQLLQNLIGNAIKYRGPQPPLVQISATCHPDHWLFAVQDNGIGIAPEYQEKIFGLFQRLSTGDAQKGTGLGLAICKRIVERNGGRIWVESECGRGSTFFFTVPKGRPS